MPANLNFTDAFPPRHIGPDAEEIQQMLRFLGAPSLEALIDQTVPRAIRMQLPLALPAGRGEHDLLTELAEIAQKNQVFRSYLGMGYSDTITPGVILRNI